MSTNPVIAGNQNPLAPDTLGLPAVNIPGAQLPTTTDVINNIPQSATAKPGHFAQLIVDGPSAFNGPVYFGASQHTAWFDCSPATVDPTVVLDFAGGPQQYLYLTRDTIVWLPTTDQQEGMFFVMVQQDAVGGWDLTWKINNPTTDGSAVVIWLAGSLPVMSSAANSVRLYTFTWCQNLNGGLGAYVGSSTADLATLGLDADLATLVLPANTTITAAAQTVLDDLTVAAMLATLGAAPSATAVVGPASATAGHILTFADTTGKVAVDSGMAPTSYTEGTWTPVLTGFTIVGSTPAITGRYKRIGNLMFISCLIFAGDNGNTSIAGAGGDTSHITGFPSAAQGVYPVIAVDGYGVGLGVGALNAYNAHLQPPAFSARAVGVYISATCET